MLLLSLLALLAVRFLFKYSACYDEMLPCLRQTSVVVVMLSPIDLHIYLILGSSLSDPPRLLAHYTMLLRVY